MINSLRIFVFSILLHGFLFSQKDNIVRNKQLNTELYNYLIKNLDSYSKDSLGNKHANIESFPKSTGIAAGNLKTDSILSDKTLVGIYRFRFTCFDCSSYLYFQYPNGNRRYFNLNEKKINFWKLLDTAETFLKKYCNGFTEQEKLKSLSGVIETIYANMSYAEK